MPDKNPQDQSTTRSARDFQKNPSQESDSFGKSKCNIDDQVTLTRGIFGPYDCRLTKKKYDIEKFVWKNQTGMEVEVITLGATVTRIMAPDKNSRSKDVLLGFETVEGYTMPNNPKFGVIIGRNAGITSVPVFDSDHHKFELSKNVDKKYHFDGGFNGFNKYVWSPFVNGNKLSLGLYSKALDEGYPGDLVVSVTYELTSKNDFIVDMKACSSETTICNLSQRLPINLAGHVSFQFIYQSGFRLIQNV